MAQFRRQAMASDLGQTAVATEFRDTSPGSTRNVFVSHKYRCIFVSHRILTLHRDLDLISGSVTSNGPSTGR